MRILFLTQVLPFPLDAGPKTRAYHVLQHLVSEGHEVTLLSFVRSNDSAENIDHLRKLCADVHTVPIKRSRVKDSLYLAGSIISGKPFLIVRDWSNAFAHRLAKVVAEKPAFDAVHADQLWMAQYALEAQKQLNKNDTSVRIVLDQHNAVHLIPKRLAESESNRVKRYILEHEARSMQRYELVTCEQFECVVWVTDEDRRTLTKAAARLHNNVTIPICVDPKDKSVLVRQPDVRRVTFLGGLHWPPNAAGIMWFAHEVWPQVLEKIPDARLTIIGKDPPRNLLDHNHGISNLDVTGYVDDVEALLEETAVFVVPLNAGGGMRVKIIDAWSWGLPIVSTTVGAEGIKYQDGEDLLIADSEKAFAQAVVRVMTQPELAERLSRAGRHRVETTYDWHKTYRDWNRVYSVLTTVSHTYKF